MSQVLKFVGGAHIREISKSDFASVGVDHPSVKVDRREDAIVEVSDDAAEWLLENDKESGSPSWKVPTTKELERWQTKQRLATASVQDESAVASKAEDVNVPVDGAGTTGTGTANTRSRST